jgi:hypothetical protein
MQLITDTSLRLRMGSAGRERVERDFSFGQRLQRIEALYAAVLDIPLASSLRQKPAAKPV